MAEGKVVAEGDPVSVMKDPAVIDAYLGAHQDVDLGVVTGRYDDGTKAKITAAQIEAEGLAELESEDK
jgi:branched-chain amino acid transport system ATP-binding protein